LALSVFGPRRLYLNSRLCCLMPSCDMASNLCPSCEESDTRVFTMLNYVTVRVSACLYVCLLIDYPHASSTSCSITSYAFPSQCFMSAASCVLPAVIRVACNSHFSRVLANLDARAWSYIFVRNPFIELSGTL